MLAGKLVSRSLSARSRALVAGGLMALGTLAGGTAVAGTESCRPDFYDGQRAYDAGNREAAIEQWTRAALQGDVLSQEALGRVYEKGDGVLIDYIQAHKWYNLAANNNLAYCSSQFGKQARIVRDHAKEARARLQDLMTARSIGDAQTALVNYYECKGSDPDYLYELGRIYLSGTGVLQSKLDACKYFAIAASRGIQAAKDALDTLNDVLKPEEVDSCQREAKAWVRKPDVCSYGVGSSNSCKGSRSVPWANRQAALKNLGYYRGPLDGSPGDGTLSAVRRYQRSLSAEETGSLTEPQICSLIESAASNGDAISAATLGEMYYQGTKGKPKDNAAAVRWLQKGADAGVPGALYRLGSMYVEGDHGVDRDLSYGCKLLRQAERAGHPGASREIDRYCDRY